VWEYGKYGSGGVEKMDVSASEIAAHMHPKFDIHPFDLSALKE
jgi:hypothetical protein